MDSSKLNSNPNPREKAKPLSVLFWWWTVSLFRKGYTKILTIEDLYDPLKKDKSSYLGDRLEKEWIKQVKYAEKFDGGPSLLRTIFLTFRTEIFCMGILHAFIEFFLRLGSPLFLGLMLQYFKYPEPKTTFEQALIYAGAMSTTSILKSISANHILFQGNHLGGRVRIAVCSLVYRKALRLSKTALGETSTGKIVNLVANDVNRFDIVTIFLHTMWSAPLLTLIIAYILYTKASFSALIGIIVLLTVVPIQAYTGSLSSKYRLQTAIKTDERVRLMDEIISGVQVIKMYAWEKPFCTLIKLARRLELRIVKKTSYLRGLFMTFFLFTTRVALYCTIMSMMMLNQPITADKIFVFSSFYNLLSYSMATMFVRGFAELAECRVSVNRLQSFLMLDEFREGNVINQDKVFDRRNLIINDNGKTEEYNHPNNKNTIRRVSETENGINKSANDYSIIMENVVAKWYQEMSENTLENINLKLRKGKLYAVIGTVGSGKSSFLSSLLGELNLVEGGIKVKGSLSYVGQDGWVFGSTVRQNILFGQVFDRQRYQRVVKACSLYKDFAQFPQGDCTIVAERGSSLSGGQKARINLARAVYRQDDVYLLDDPLSAVDANVGKHLFEECIKGYLQDKTRILATHQLQFIKEVDGIILLVQGKMRYYKNFHVLLKDCPEYGTLIALESEQSPKEEFLMDRTELRRRFSSTGSSSRVSESGVDQDIKDEKDNSRNFKDMIEDSSKGVIKGSAFLQYFKSGSNICVFFVMTVLFILTQILVSLNDFCVPFIITAEETRAYYENHKNEFNHTAKEELYPSSEILIYAYTVIVFLIFVVGLIRSFVFYGLCMRSSERLHNSAFFSLIRASMKFFDQNPSGRILNRFSKDTTAMDEYLPKALLDSGQTLLAISGAIILTCAVNPIFLIPVAIVGAICYQLRKVYLKTSKNVKRLEGMTRSPVFTHLNATLNGLSTIRACQAQSILQKEFDRFQDVHTSSWYMYTSCSLAYAFALDFFTFSCITFITFSFLLLKDSFSGGEVGLAITQMMSIVGKVQWAMRQSAEVTNQIMSVERILEYTQIEPEKNVRVTGDANLKKKKKKKVCAMSMALVSPLKNWPSRGTVEFKNVFMRYAPDEDPVLKDLNFTIDPTEKVGIVGRTGAGKSSLITALFRLAPLEGSIEIDGVDTGSISVKDLRSRLSIIPQNPVLFSGTLRRNLDPFSEFPDETLWEALSEVEFKDAIVATDCGLDYRVLDRGANFSVGQRQLVCLARAVLRKNRILMLDEATANVDPQTDALIQRTIRTKFAECTVLTVAHRLNTIIDSDKVIVMDKGSVTEFDHPYVLLQKETSQFTSLVKETGDAMFEQLFALAKQCYREKDNSDDTQLRNR